LIGEGFFELCLLDGGLIVDGRLEVALGLGRHRVEQELQRRLDILPVDAAVFLVGASVSARHVRARTRAVLTRSRLRADDGGQHMRLRGPAKSRLDSRESFGLTRESGAHSLRRGYTRLAPDPVSASGPG
jgi:hypothetical protein